MLRTALNHFYGHWQLILLTTVIFMLWNTGLVYPLRLLIVFLHELSHAAATILTGGSVLEFNIATDESGHVISLGS
jgi:hypothetical protein